MALKRGSGSGAGGALIVAALPPVAGQAVGAQFWLEEEETLWRVEEYSPPTVPGTIDSTDLLDSDFDDTIFNDTWLWAGNVIAVPATPATGNRTGFWDTTPGNTLGPAAEQGLTESRFKIYYE